MNANTDLKLILKIFIFLLSLFLITFSGVFHSAFCDTPSFISRINAPPDCNRIKKRIAAARELYIVDNKLPPDAKVSFRDIVSARYLKYEFVCPEGGRYSLKNGVTVECSVCDAPGAVKKNASSDTAAVGLAVKSEKNSTLETKINKYLDIDDIEFLNNPQKSSPAVLTLPDADTITADTADAEIKRTVKRSGDPFENSVDSGGEEDAGDESDNTEEQISVKEESNIGKGARDFHAEAIEHARRGEVDNAIEKFKKAVELVPDSFIYHYNYGLFLAKIESYDLAYIEFQRALRLDPQNAKIKVMIEKLKKAISSR